MEVMSRNGCKKLDKYTIDEVGIPSLVLMENAANKVFDKIVNLEGKFIVFCGNGNNGGDGLAIARKLILEEKDVCIVIVSKDEKYSADFLININILRKLTKNFIYIRNIEDIDFLKEVSSNYNIAIDCIFGVGLNRVLDVFYTKIINYINDKWEFIISIDVPSGLNCDNGEIMGTSILANKTYTFEVVKMGFINYKALRYLGEVEVLRIGIPQYVKKINSEKVYILSRDDYGKLLRKREKYGHKGMYGKVAILAGSKGYTGAAYISTQSCVMAGAGLTTLVTTKYVQDKLSSKLVEAMTANIESLENLKDLFQKVNVIAIGPGIDEEIKYKDIFLNLIKYKDKKFVIDAGAFNL
ncbi:MAG: NAD(P)H-hydrate epimerase, partial [Clostridium sp.]